jgi:hypothetical protein
VDISKGTFYLGGTGPEDDPAAEPMLYDARDLTTHGVVVGMTGSGKTGLAIDVLEEALLSGIPVLALDPKGDVGNLLLTFPDLRPEDFRPWVNEGDAARKGLTVDEFARQTSELWRNGLASWGVPPERIRQLREEADFRVYTPGSSSGNPVNVVGSLRAPGLDWETEEEVIRDEIEGFVTGLLGLVGIDADPIGSREHILIANLIEHAWRARADLDIASLIQQIQDPPIRKLGVFEVDAFFPARDRTALAMRLNGLVASPSFGAWLAGPPLDVGAMLDPGGSRPQAAIVYLAHLSDAERQFVVTLILSRVVTWMRGLSGTTDLRALVYMDEVFGFAPPTAQPPSKKPILTLLKTARAFGVGLVLATQNPVDLDYKAMSNAGTWFVGRLQTDRDKARILEALQSAGGDVDIAAMDGMISGLGARRFVMHNTHEPPPRVFQTRWAMSYLRGPLTRDQIAQLARAAPARPQPDMGATPAPAPEASPGPSETSVPPPVAEGVPVLHVDPGAAWASDVGAVPAGRRLRAGIAARVRIRFDDARAGVDHTEEWEAVVVPVPEYFDPAAARPVDFDDRDLRPEPPPGAVYELPDAPVAKATYFRTAAADLKQHLARERLVTVFRNRSLKAYSRVGETRDQFASRCDTLAQAEADRETARIRDRLEARGDRLEAALGTSRQRVEQAEIDVKSRGQQEIVAGAGSVISILLGGRGNTRTIATRAGGAIGSASSRRGMTARARERLESAREKVTEREEDLRQLEQELLEEITEIDRRWRERGDDIEDLAIAPESSDVQVEEIALIWIPTA